MLIYHKGHTDTIQVYSVTVMTHVKALQAGHSSQGTSEPITLVAEAGWDVYGLCTLGRDRLKFCDAGGHRCSEFWCIVWLLSVFACCDRV